MNQIQSLDNQYNSAATAILSQSKIVLERPSSCAEVLKALDNLLQPERKLGGNLEEYLFLSINEHKSIICKEILQNRNTVINFKTNLINTLKSKVEQQLISLVHKQLIMMSSESKYKKADMILKRWANAKKDGLSPKIINFYKDYLKKQLDSEGLRKTLKRIKELKERVDGNKTHQALAIEVCEEWVQERTTEYIDYYAKKYFPKQNFDINNFNNCSFASPIKHSQPSLKRSMSI